MEEGRPYNPYQDNALPPPPVQEDPNDPAVIRARRRKEARRVRFWIIVLGVGLGVAAKQLEPVFFPAKKEEQKQEDAQP